MSERHLHPRLLLITSSAFNHLSGGGITFTNLFKGWPKDRIACAHDDQIAPTRDVCENYYYLATQDIAPRFPFSLFWDRKKPEQKTAQKTSEHSAKTARQKIATGCKSLVKWLLCYEIPKRVTISPAFQKWIEEFKPEVIYTVLGSTEYMSFVEAVAARYNLPVVVHMMDDWPNMRYRAGLFSSLRRFLLKRQLARIIQKAAVCLGICDAMCTEYSRRYGKPFFAFHNALESESWKHHARHSWKAHTPFQMLYGGALMRNSQLGSLIDVARGVDELVKRGEKILFTLYAPWYDAQKYHHLFKRFRGVQLKEMPDAMNIESLFIDTDLLILPVNFDDTSRRYIRFSMPTKVPAYMFSGTPTLAYGPADVASIDYAQQWAECVTQQSVPHLAETIFELMYDEAKRESLGKKARDRAHIAHDATRLRAEFYSFIIKAAGHIYFRTLNVHRNLPVA